MASAGSTVADSAGSRGGFHGFGGGGFHFGGFGGGGSRFGDGGFADRSTDAGFGRGGFGSVHNASNFSEHADTFQQAHPEYQHNASQFKKKKKRGQQNRFNEANTLQQNRYNAARSLQYNRESTWNNYHGSWGGYYSGLGFGAGFAIGATIAALPAAATRSQSPERLTGTRTVSITPRKPDGPQSWRRRRVLSFQRLRPPAPRSISIRQDLRLRRRVL